MTASAFQYTKNEVLLDVRNVSVSYGEKVILRDVNAQVTNIVRPGLQQGQVIALLGPSGIGKSTLFRVLSGIMQPNGKNVTGSVLVGAKQVPVLPGAVGVVAQHYPLLSHYTVMQNLMVGAQAKDDSRAQCEALLEEFRLTEHADKYPIQLSGGQRQRVAIAQQLLCSDNFLIMDEPFSGLDPVAHDKVANLILGVSQRHEENTLIVVTHDIEAAIEIAGTIWLMGRDRGAAGNIIPGARIMDVIDLIELNICWHERPMDQAGANDLLRKIHDRFHTL